MRVRKLRTIFLSSPDPIFLDTGILIGLCNTQEEILANKIIDFLGSRPQAPRLFVEPCLVEFFYKMKKIGKIVPKDLQTNLDSIGAVTFPLLPQESDRILKSYFQLTYKNNFDYADYFLCCSALQFSKSTLLTIDRRDLPLALAAAQKSGINSASHSLQLIPFCDE